ncbi:MAG: TonB-dependent receptor [Prevotella sp.]|nr:TonB-dependent receptor [Prevotella sp.]MDY4038701.1 TonB-dependent receptor [Prevotella sp.]
MKRQFVQSSIFLLLLGSLPFSSVYASGYVVHGVSQQDKLIDVQGTVLDDTGSIVGASVKIVGSKTGTVTDINGVFHLKVPTGAKLEISNVGYETKVIVFKGERNLQVRLHETAVALDDVQVIAYGTTRKVTVTGALSSVNSQELLKSPVASMSNALTGKISGLSSVQSSGQPGADNAQLFIRGVGSLSTSLSRPLILVDGVERSFTQIDPNEVDNVTVLKDASATAVFGVRGANGVILVTTKRGSKNKPRVSFSSSVGVQMPSRVPEFANSYEWASEFNKAQRHDGVADNMLAFTEDDLEKFRTHSSPLTHPDVNWTEMMIRNAAVQSQHNLNISGGTDRVKYFASLGVFSQEGLFKVFKNRNDKGFKYNRYNYRVNLDIDVTRTTAAKINLGGYLNNRREPNYNNGSSSSITYLFRDLYSAVPFSGAGLVDGKRIRMNSNQFKIGNLQDGLNIYYGKGYNTTANNTLNFDFTLTQRLDFLTRGLNFHVKAAYNSGVTIVKRREGREPFYEPVLTPEGEVALKLVETYQKLGFAEGDGLSKNWYFEGAFNYKRNFGKHHVSALAMYNQTMKYYPSSTYPDIPRSYVGLVGRATYDYMTKYLADFSMGYNGSENFAKGHRFGFFPAGSLGWIVSEEPFFKPLRSTVSYLKFRASLGKVGNDITSDSSRFLYLPDTYVISAGTYSFGTTTSTKVRGASEGKVGNPDVTWETATKQNYGVDMKLLGNRLTFNFDYFIEHRRNILISRGVIPVYLAVQLPTVNLGKVNNKGYEVSLRWEEKVKNVRYYIGGNLSYAKNKIIFRDEITYPYEWMQRTGKPVGQGFGYVFDGFFTEEEAANYDQLKGKEGGIADQGSGFIPLAGDVKYKDLNGDMKIDEKDVRDIGYPGYPLYSLGLNMGLSWKGFDFSATFAGAFQTSRLLSLPYRIPFGEMNNWSLMRYMIDDAWTPEKGDAATAPAISLRSKSHNYLDSDLWLRNASYLRLKNIEVGYSFPKRITKSLRLNTLRVAVSGYNLLTFDNLKISDPEINPDGRTYPLIKILNFGLNIGF